MLKKGVTITDTGMGAGAGAGAGAGTVGDRSADKPAIIPETEGTITKRGKKLPTTEELKAASLSFDVPVSVEEGADWREEAIKAKPKKDPFVWSQYTVAELIRFQDEIQKHLPAMTLESFDMEKNMLRQYHLMTEFQSEVMKDMLTPANQKAQLVNAISSLLRTLADMQVALYSAERFKDVENLMIKILSTLPEKEAEAFLENYERLQRASEESK